MTLLKTYAGTDMLAEHAPVTFHLDGDEACGSSMQMVAKYGYLTGFDFFDKNGKGHACLFDVEKAHRALPFTPENARTLSDQILPLHEATHIWFGGRDEDAQLEEPFAKMTSFVVSGTDPDPCAQWNRSSGPDSLIAALCGIGFVITDLPEVLHRAAVAAGDKGRPLTNGEVAAVISDVIGADARPAFRIAGLL